MVRRETRRYSCGHFSWSLTALLGRLMSGPPVNSHNALLQEMGSLISDISGSIFGANVLAKLLEWGFSLSFTGSLVGANHSTYKEFPTLLKYCHKFCRPKNMQNYFLPPPVSLMSASEERIQKYCNPGT